MESAKQNMIDSLRRLKPNELDNLEWHKSQGTRVLLGRLARTFYVHKGVG